MKDIKVASRYAKSLLGIALENKCLEAVQQDMMMISRVSQENREFIALLKSPIVRGDKKNSCNNI